MKESNNPGGPDLGFIGDTSRSSSDRSDNEFQIRMLGACRHALADTL